MKDIKLFTIGYNEELADKVGKSLGVKVSELEIDHFADGEILVKLLDDVKDKDVFVIGSIAKPSNESLMELLIFVNAARNNGAKSIHIITPYMGYSRQDRVAKPGEPITSQLVAEMISYSGASSFVTFDIHTTKTIEYFKIPARNVSSCDIFANYYKELLKEKHIDLKDVVIVSPDHGSYNRASELSKLMEGTSFAIISKYRPAPNVAKSIKLDGDVNGKYAIIFDDIIDTANTLKGAMELLKQNGAKDIFIGATHGVFSEGSIERIKDASDIVVTDSIASIHKEVKKISLSDKIVNLIKEM